MTIVVENDGGSMEAVHVEQVIGAPAETVLQSVSVSHGEEGIEISQSQGDGDVDVDDDYDDHDDDDQSDTEAMAPYCKEKDLLRTSKIKRDSAAIMHGNCYLKDFRLSSKKIETLTMEELNNDFMMGLLKYLGSDARLKCNKLSSRISHTSADNYLSGLKNYFCNKCLEMNTNVPLIFSDRNTASNRKILLGLFVDECIQTGTNLSEPHIPATKTDQLGISTACVWQNSVRAAKFMNLNTKKFHYIGRGTEISLARHEYEV